MHSSTENTKKKNLLFHGSFCAYLRMIIGSKRFIYINLFPSAVWLFFSDLCVIAIYLATKTKCVCEMWYQLKFFFLFLFLSVENKRKIVKLNHLLPKINWIKYLITKTKGNLDTISLIYRPTLIKYTFFVFIDSRDESSRKPNPLPTIFLFYLFFNSKLS